MNKFKKLSRAEMKNVKGGELPNCVVDCYSPWGDWETSASGEGCPSDGVSNAICATGYGGPYDPSNPQYNGSYTCTCY